MKKIKITSKEQWLELRGKGIGGSDAAGVLGFSPWSNQYSIWMSKVNPQLVPDISDNDAIKWGVILEDVVAKQWALENNKKIRKVPYLYQHDTHDWMIGSLDREIVGEPDALLEVKTTGQFNASKWDDGVPDNYMVQVQHYLGITGKKRAYLVVLIGGQKMISKTIERDDALIEQMIKICGDFWNNHVLTKVPPEINDDVPNELFNAMFPVADEGKEINFGEDKLAVLTEYDKLLIQEAEIESKKNHIISVLKDGMGVAERGFIGQYKVSWTNVQSKRIDSTLLKIKNPRIYNKYCKEINSRRFTITKVKEEKE